MSAFGAKNGFSRTCSHDTNGTAISPIALM